MATAANLSPASKRFGDFSRYQFEHRPLPIGATYTGEDGWESTGISYDDYRGMHLEKRKHTAERRLETPTWAVNDSELKLVLVRYLELRASFKKQQTGTLEERMARAMKRRLDTKAQHIKIIDKTCEEYTHLKKVGECAAKVQKLGQIIESMDTEIRLLGNEDKIAAGVVYRYYRLGEDSVAVGTALGIKPPHVRQLLWRLRKAADRVASETPVKLSMRINMLRGLKASGVRMPGEKQRQCWQCGAIFTPLTSMHVFCKRPCRRKHQIDVARKKRHAAGTKTARRYFCSTECKETGINIKKVMITLKPGIGQFVAPPNGDSYDSYVQYCKVIGVEPMTRDQFSQGLVNEAAFLGRFGNPQK